VADQSTRKHSAWGSSSYNNRGKITQASALKHAIKKMGASNTPEVKKAIRAAQAQRIWERIAPQEVLNHTDNVYLLSNDGIKEMIIRVDSPLWAAELSAQAEQFRMQVEEALNEGPLERISFKVDSYVSKRKAFKHQSDEQPSYIEDVSPVSLTEKERENIEEEAAGIRNEEVREALIRARIKDLEWKKGIEGDNSR
jgi:hypothetical protein